MTRGIEIAGALYLSASQVAEEIRVSRQTVWRWRKEGKIPAGRIFRDGRILFTADEVQAVRAYANRLEPAILDTPPRSTNSFPVRSRALQSTEEATKHG